MWLMGLVYSNKHVTERKSESTPFWTPQMARKHETYEKVQINIMFSRSREVYDNVAPHDNANWTSSSCSCFRIHSQTYFIVIVSSKKKWNWFYRAKQREAHFENVWGKWATNVMSIESDLNWTSNIVLIHRGVSFRQGFRNILSSKWEKKLDQVSTAERCSRLKIFEASKHATQERFPLRETSAETKIVWAKFFHLFWIIFAFDEKTTVKASENVFLL